MESAEFIEAVHTLQDNVIELPKVLEQFSPDHVHWPAKDQPWFLRSIPSFIRAGAPFGDVFVETAYLLYLRGKGFKFEWVRASSHFSVACQLQPVSNAVERKALLFFREVDFIFRLKYGNDESSLIGWDFNTTRIEGDSGLYHIFTPNLRLSWPEGHEVHPATERDQQFLTTLLRAKML